jgi:hypothetical protein
MDPNEIIPSKIVFYDLDGTPITEVESISTRSWRLNDCGEINFLLSIYDEKCRQDVIEFGRFVMVTHPKLPPWAGPIDTPREWGSFQVMVHGYSGERQLFKRFGALQTITGTPGNLFQQIVNIANREGDTLIRVGSIWSDGKSAPRKLEYRDLLTEVKELAQKSKNDFGIEPAIENQKLVFRAHWWKQRGEKCNLTLQEGGDGHNMESNQTPLREQGDLVNDLLGYGDGASWASRLKSRRKNETSRKRFGLYQFAMAFPDAKSQTALDQAVEAELARRAFPRKSMALSALDVGDTWLALRLGNILPAKQSFAGFTDSGGIGSEGNVRILSMAYGDKGRVELVSDQYDE